MKREIKHEERGVGSEGKPWGFNVHVKGSPERIEQLLRLTREGLSGKMEAPALETNPPLKDEKA